MPRSTTMGPLPHCLQGQGPALAALLLQVLLAVSIQPGSAQVRIVEPLTSAVTVGYGGRLLLVCRHSGHAPLRWYFNGVPVTSGRTMTVTPSDAGRGRQLTLTVTRVTQESRGRYQCTNQNNYYDYDFRRVEVSATAPRFIDRRVDIVQPDSDAASVGEGGALSLKCEGGAAAELTWLHDDKKVEADARVLVTSAENGTRDVTTSVLTVMNLAEEDEGIYVCYDANNYQNADLVNVTVVRANISQEVRITDPPGSRAVFTKGRILAAKCRGNESRLLEWRHNGRPVVPGSRVIITTARLAEDHVVEMQLSVHEAKPEDAGEYMCRDRADLLQKDSFRAIIVTPRKDVPVRITSPALNETSVPAGGALRVTCTVAGLNTGLKWKLNGLPLTRGPRVDLLTSRHRKNRTLTSVLTVVNVTLMDTGRYTCEDVRDELNYQELDISLLQQITPITLFIEEPPGNYISVMPGDYLHIKCVATEDTSVKWRHNGRVFDPRDRLGYVVSSLMDVRRHTMTSMLAVFSITEDDSGVFTCEDTEDYRNSASIGIRVPRPVNITTGDLELYEGDLLRIPCEAGSGTDLQWLRDDQLINSTADGVVVRTINNALEGTVKSLLRYKTIANHTGEYTCRDKHFPRNQVTVSVIFKEIEEKPELHITTPRTIISKEGKKLILRCKVSRGVIPYWTFNDVEVKSERDVFVMTTLMTSGDQWATVIVSPLTLLSSGVYECRDRRARAKTARSFVVVQPRK